MKIIAEYNIINYAGDDRYGRKILVCSACRLPNDEQIRLTYFQTLDYFYDCLYNYILKTYDPYVNMDYVIVYFHHGLHSRNRPSYTWLVRAYRRIDRK
jgi:Rho GTPase-activating protein 1